jgi:hypothetical protein
MTRGVLGDADRRHQGDPHRSGQHLKDVTHRAVVDQLGLAFAAVGAMCEHHRRNSVHRRRQGAGHGQVAHDQLNGGREGCPAIRIPHQGSGAPARP